MVVRCCCCCWFLTIFCDEISKHFGWMHGFGRRVFNAKWWYDNDDASNWFCETTTVWRQANARTAATDDDANKKRWTIVVMYTVFVLCARLCVWVSECIITSIIARAAQPLRQQRRRRPNDFNWIYSIPQRTHTYTHPFTERCGSMHTSKGHTATTRTRSQQLVFGDKFKFGCVCVSNRIRISQHTLKMFPSLFFMHYKVE